jgi:hypothetical protein
MRGDLNVQKQTYSQQEGWVCAPSVATMTGSGVTLSAAMPSFSRCAVQAARMTALDVVDGAERLVHKLDTFTDTWHQILGLPRLTAQSA